MSSFNRVTFTGAEDTIPVPFGYIDKSHVGVTLDGTTTTAFTWLSSGLIKLNSTPPSGVVGEAKRTTPASRLVVFSPGNLDVDDLNVSTWQAILIAEEAKDTLNDLLGRGWVTSGFQLGGTITKAGLGFVPTFDASGNLTLVTSAEDIVEAQGYASAALGYRNEAQSSALSAAGSASLASGYAASINPANFYTKAEIDGYRAADQNAAKNASNLNTGTVANARLPLRLNELAGSSGVDDANTAIVTGWYMARNTAANLPSANYGFLEVQAVSVNEIRQYLTLTTSTPGEKWTRRYAAGSWSSWVRVYETAADIQAILHGGSAEVATTSGVAALIPSIPAGVQKVHVIFKSVSESAGSPLILRLGTSGGIVSTGYDSRSGYRGSESSNTTGFHSVYQLAAGNYSGCLTFYRLSGNKWFLDGKLHQNDGLMVGMCGNVDLAAELTQIQLTTLGGTATLDSGSIQAFWSY